MYEIHITVNPASLEAFKETCAALGCKPIFIELDAAVPQQLMTSSHIVGDLVYAHEYCKKLEQSLKDAGFVPIRIKIETLMSCGPDEDEGRYYEMHVKFCTHNLEELRKFAQMEEGHMSHNALKLASLKSGELRFVTWRFYRVGKVQAMKQAEHILEKAAAICGPGLEIVSYEREYVVYDSNIHCDDGW